MNMNQRTITTHKVNPANDKLDILVLDTAGAGGANHLYQISGFDSASNPSDPWKDLHGKCGHYSMVLFQNGTIPEKGVNGVTQEALLAIVQDRLEAFQAGPFACDENQRALQAVKEALHWLHYRTLKRMARTVEGSHVV